MRFILILLCIRALSGATYAAPGDSLKPQALAIRLHYNFMLLHSKDIAPIGPASPVGIGVEWSKQYTTQKAWEFCNCYPRWGHALAFWNFDKPGILGSGIVTYSFVEPWWGPHRRFSYSMRLGGGIGFLTTPYDSLTNPWNYSYSTRLNGFLAVNTTLNWRISSQFVVRMTAEYLHLSNGGVKVPNKGINYPGFSVAADYTFHPVNLTERIRSVYRRPPDNPERIDIIGFYSFRNAAPNKPQYRVLGASLRFSHFVGRKSAVTMGAEMIGDHALRQYLDSYFLDELEEMRVGALIGHEFLLGKVRFSTEMGIYLFDEWPIHDRIYQRWGLVIQFHKHFFGGINLRAHRHVADFIDFRFGISL